MEVEGVYEGENDTNTDSDVDNGKDLAPICLRGEISKPNGGKSDEGEIKSIKITPSLQFMIGDCTNN